MSKLLLTYYELEEIMNQNILTDRFEITHHDIPYPEHMKKGDKYQTSDYMEDDGRMFYMCLFKDNKTNTEYCVNYVYNQEHSTEFPSALFDVPKGIEFVKESVLFNKEEPEIENVVKTFEEKRCLNQEEEYNNILKMEFDAQTSDIPLRVIDSLTTFIRKGNFTKRDLLDKLTPVCIEYKIERNSLWNYVKK